MISDSSPNPKLCPCGGSGWTPGLLGDEPCLHHADRKGRIAWMPPGVSRSQAKVICWWQRRIRRAEGGLLCFESIEDFQNWRPTE